MVKNRMGQKHHACIAIAAVARALPDSLGARRPSSWSANRLRLALGLIFVIFVIDRFLAHYSPPLVISPALTIAALLDESAHLATALVLLTAWRPHPARPFVWGTVLGAVAIDVDHLPLLFGSDVLSAGTGRPYSHSLLTIIVTLVVARWLPEQQRPLARGLAFGFAAHLIRDMAIPFGVGVPLFWPASARGIDSPYQVYAALLLLAFSGAAWRARVAAGQPDSRPCPERRARGAWR